MEDNNEVEDSERDDNNFKDISALGLDRDLDFHEDIKGTKGIDLLMMMIRKTTTRWRTTRRWRTTTRTTITSRICQLWD